MDSNSLNDIFKDSMEHFKISMDRVSKEVDKVTKSMSKKDAEKLEKGMQTAVPDAELKDIIEKAERIKKHFEI